MHAPVRHPGVPSVDVTGVSSGSYKIFLNSGNHAKTSSVHQLTNRRTLSSWTRVESVLWNSAVVKQLPRQSMLQKRFRQNSCRNCRVAWPWNLEEHQTQPLTTPAKSNQPRERRWFSYFFQAGFSTHVRRDGTWMNAYHLSSLSGEHFAERLRDRIACCL